ncbi:MAG TPA: hypothetical protein VNO30_17030 [Kofleriaceae bacterium]|nr:hypothetical protein [Kofleriaceae bacterium]
MYRSNLQAICPRLHVPTVRNPMTAALHVLTVRNPLMPKKFLEDAIRRARGRRWLSRPVARTEAWDEDVIRRARGRWWRPCGALMPTKFLEDAIHERC